MCMMSLIVTPSPAGVIALSEQMKNMWPKRPGDLSAVLQPPVAGPGFPPRHVCLPAPRPPAVLAWQPTALPFSGTLRRLRFPHAGRPLHPKQPS